MARPALAEADRTRQLIIEESAVLFNQKGYAGTSMNDITLATRLSKGGVYAHFKSKEEIALAAFDFAVQKVTQRVRECTQAVQHPLEKLRAVVRFYRENIFTPPVEGGCPIQNTSVEADDSNPALRERVQAAMDVWKQGIIYILHKGKDKNLIREDADPEVFALQFIGTLEGAILLARLYRDVKYFDTLAVQLLQMIDDLANPAAATQD
ncbi:MAG: TetR/AcrR family transcriptional regulator [Saprospiraceae bacterium]